MTEDDEWYYRVAQVLAILGADNFDVDQTLIRMSFKDGGVTELSVVYNLEEGTYELGIQAYNVGSVE